MASPLLAGLSEAGLLEPTLAAWLADEEVQTVTDLIHCFRTEADALRSAPIAHAAWRWANSTGPARWERTAADRRLAVRDLSMNERLGDPVAEARRRAPKRARAVRPRAKGKPGPQKEKDRRDRLAAAAEAVRRSASWGPGTGIAQGIPRGDPLIDQVAALYTRRLAKFETNGIRAALRVLDAWVLYREEHSKLHSQAEQSVLMAEFVESQSSATGPLNVWNKLDWVRRHLKIEVPISEVPKPGRGETAATGRVEQAAQAVAAPPEYLVAFEEALRRMDSEGDWRRVALAAGLQVAYSLFRIAHMGRSQFLSTSTYVLWLEAFRGKGKREGARKPFKWAMPRHGISGLDVGGVIYEAWDEWSRSSKVALDYIVMDPRTGAQMHGTHVDSVLKEVAQ